MLNSLAAVVMSICVAASAALAGTGQMAGPSRVAIIYSSCVNNDFRGLHDYDGQLASLGWAYDKYRNTELDKLMARIDDYQLIYTTSLWNYGDPQDFHKWAPTLRKWLQAGGCLVLTDMAYGSHEAVPPLLGDNLEVSCDICKKTVFSPTFTSQIITQPNHVGGEPFWAHFTKWGSAYQIGAECGEGKPVLLTAGIGKGLLVVTTTWHHDPALMANIWAADQGTRRGLVAYLKQPKISLLPGQGKIPVTLLSYRDKPQKVALKVAITPTQQSVPQAEGALRQDEQITVDLPARRQKTLGVPYKLQYRGPIKVAVTAQGEAAPAAEATATVVVPQALEVNVWGSHVLRDHFPAVAVTTNMPAGGAALKVTAYVDGLTATSAPARPGPGQPVSFPKAKGIAKAGAHRLSFVLRQGAKQVLKVTENITVDEKSEPGARVTVRGRQVFVNGKPFFPIGTYHIGTSDFASLRQHGFNCVTGPIYGGEQTSVTTDQREFYVDAAKAGLMVLSELSDFLRGGRHNYQGAADIASELVPYPAMLCNYLVDEPYPSIGPDVVEPAYKAVAAADPYHPQLVCLNDPSSYGFYTKCCDIYSTDPYPIPPQGVAKSVARVAAAVGLMRAKWPTGPIWVAIQSHRNPPPQAEDAKWVWPTPEQVRCMSFLALNHGATGLLFYAWGDAYTDQNGKVRGSGFKYNKALYDSYYELNPVLAELGPKYVTGLEKAPAGIVAEKDVDAAIVRDGTQRLLVLVNPLSEARTATVNLGVAKAKRLTAREQFSPAAQGGKVELPPFGVGVYVLR